MLVGKLADGILHEGKFINKEKEMQWISQQLIHIKDASVEQIYDCCAHLYSMECFLSRPQ